MTFIETFYQVKQLLVDRLIDFGLEDADIDFGWTTLLTLSQNTRITIDIPLNLTYSDEFEITGTLETATYRRLSHKTLKLKVGNTIVDTTETDINGVYSFTTTPVSTGNHSFQVIFEGTDIYHASQSSVVNRVIGKETSVINLDIIPTAHINGLTVVAGTLKSDDAELIKNATMKLTTPSSSTLTTTTNNYGQFSFNLTDIPDFNNVSITCYFEGDSYYSSSTITTLIPVYQEALELTSDKNILSYADSDYATLTVQYKDEGDMNLGAGRKIDLYILYVDGIEVTNKIATLTTDANGQATYRYDSIGVGDVTLGATFEDDDSGVTTETYTIWDANLTSSNMNISNDGNKITLKNNVTGYGETQIDNLAGISPTNMIVEFDSYAPNQTYNSESIGLCVYGDSSARTFIEHNQDGNKRQLVWTNYGSGSYQNYNIELKQRWLHNKFIFQNNNMTYELYYENTLLASKTLNLNPALLNSYNFHYTFICPWASNGERYVKNFKITKLQ